MADPHSRTVSADRMVPLSVWVLVLATLVLIPFKIMGYGYLPRDDARRHAAKIISGKEWPEILVMRPDITIDLHEGWHSILGFVHKTLHADVDGLVVFEVVSLYAAVVLLPLVWLRRRPEAWVLSLLLGILGYQGLIYRLTLGRPFLLPELAMMAGLFLWTRKQQRRSLAFLATVLLVALAVWTHGGWYLFALPVVAFFLAGFWREGLGFGLSWAAGAFLGGALTGQPITFLSQQAHHMMNVMGHAALQRMLVPELQPFDGAYPFVMIVVCLLLFLRLVRGGWRREDVLDPAFVLGALGWALSFQVARFWVDWGLPAMLVWMARQFQDVLSEKVLAGSLQRLRVTFMACLALFLGATSDMGGRWTDNLSIDYLDGSNPQMAEWMPEAGGILYSPEMSVFFRTFYKNPTAPWRYALGFESGLMTDENLEIFRKLQWNFGKPECFKPWVEKMKPADRLVIYTSPDRPPVIPELQWRCVASDTWVGRLPRAEKDAGRRGKAKTRPAESDADRAR